MQSVAGDFHGECAPLTFPACFRIIFRSRFIPLIAPSSIQPTPTFRYRIASHHVSILFFSCIKLHYYSLVRLCDNELHCRIATIITCITGPFFFFYFTLRFSYPGCTHGRMGHRSSVRGFSFPLGLLLCFVSARYQLGFFCLRRISDRMSWNGLDMSSARR